MQVHVLFFGATAQIAGDRVVELQIENGTTAAKVFDKLLNQFSALANHKLHFAINQQYAIGDEIINAGDEIAVFTAVSGG